MGCFIFGGGGKKGDSSLDFSKVTMEPQYALAGKKFFNKDKELKAGTILNWDGTLLIPKDEAPVPGADVIEPSLTRRYIPSGKYLGKPVELAPMPQGSVSVIFRDPYSYEIAKTAGYINGTTELVVLPEGKMLIDINNSPTSYALDHTYATATNEFHAIAMADVDNVENTFLIAAFAHGSVSNGEIAAFTLLKENGAWGMIAYKVGDYPKYISSSYLSVELTPTGGGDPIPYYWRVRLLTKSGDSAHCTFSTSKYYEGFGLYL